MEKGVTEDRIFAKMLALLIFARCSFDMATVLGEALILSCGLQSF